MSAGDIARALAERFEMLVRKLLPNGHREGREWRAGNVQGDPGSSFVACLTGFKAGVWHDFATGESGDALDLVKAVIGVYTSEALRWSRRWLGIEDGTAALPARPAARQKSDAPEPDLVAAKGAEK